MYVSLVTWSTYNLSYIFKIGTEKVSIFYPVNYKTNCWKFEQVEQAELLNEFITKKKKRERDKTNESIPSNSKKEQQWVNEVIQTLAHCATQQIP